MGTPVATSQDLATYLGAEVDDPRMTQVLGYAQALLEAIKTPCPVSAAGIVVSIAARDYLNPGSATGIALGTGRAELATTALGGVGGLYVSKSERAAYRAMTGGTAAFSADTLPSGVNEVQQVTVSATSGTFVLSFYDVDTAPIAFDATAVDVQAALQAVGAIGAGNVSVSGLYTVSFVGNLAARPVPLLGVDPSGLTGSASVSRVTPGVFAPGHGLAPWDRQHDYDPQVDWRAW